MGEKLELSPEKPVIKFEDLRLSEIKFESPEPGNRGDYSGAETMVELELDGVLFSLFISKVERNTNLGDARFSFSIQNNQKGVGRFNTSHSLFSSLEFTPISANSEAVTAYIAHRGDKEGKELFPKGFGILFYGKMLDLIQDEANKEEKNFLHIVTREKRRSMDEDQWYKIFSRLLSDRGYEMIEGDGTEKFQKMYVPEKKS